MAVQLDLSAVLEQLAGRPSATLRTRSGAQWTGRLGFTDTAGLLTLFIPGGAHGNKPYTIFVMQDALEALW